MSKRLLVVDDAMIIREKIKDAAMNDGWEIVGEGANGQEAIDLYQQLGPDVMTIDLVMPEYDGIHGLKGVIQEDPSARVLVVSALDQTDVLKNAIREGASDFIVKPFEESRLIQALNTINQLNRDQSTQGA